MKNRGASACQEVALRTNRKSLPLLPAHLTGSEEIRWTHLVTDKRFVQSIIIQGVFVFFLWSGLPSPKFSMGSFEIHRKLLIWHIRLPTSAGFFLKKTKRLKARGNLFFFPIHFFSALIYWDSIFFSLSYANFSIRERAKHGAFSDCGCPLHISTFPTDIGNTAYNPMHTSCLETARLCGLG